MAEKKIVAQFIIEGQSAKQELDSLRAAEEQFLQAGNTLATDVTQNLREIEQSAGKAFEKLESGGKVSQTQFDGMVAKLGAVKEAIQQSGVAVEKLPEEFKKALDTAETQVKALSGAMDAAKNRTEDLKEEFGRAGREAEALAQKTKTSGERIKDAAERAGDAFEKFGQVMTDNPKEALELLPRVAAQVIQLRNEINKAQAAGGVVDQADINRLKQFENQLEQAKNEARSMKIEIDKATAGVNDASQTWQGFDGVINGLAGKFGKAGVAAVGMAAAINQGWSAGMQFNQFVGTDMSEWDKVMAKVAVGFKIAFQEMADNAVATGNLIVTALTPGDGYAERVKQAYGALREEFAESAKVVANFGEEIDKETAKKKANEDATKSNAAAQKALADEQAKAAAEAAKHAAEQKRLEDQIAAVTLALETNIERLKELEAAGVDAEHGVINSTSQMGYYGREVETATQAVARQRAEVEALTQSHGAQSPVVDQARAKLQQLEQQLASAEGRYATTSDAVAAFEDKQISAEQAGARLRQIIEQQTQQQTTLTQQYGAAAAATGQAATSTDTAAAATQKVGDAAGTAAPKIELVKDALGNVTIKSNEVKTAADAAATGLDGVVGSAQKLAAAFGSEGVVAEIDSITIAVNALNDALIRVHDTAIEVKRKLSEMDAEGDSATGGGSGSSGSSGGGSGGGF